MLRSRFPAAFTAVFAVFVFSFQLVGAAEPPPNGPRSGRWAHEGSQLAPDERVIWGKLDNGFRYALLPHRGVPGRVALRLIVLSGSIDEEADELGIAHFTEHMVFRGTKNFAAAEMVALFHRLGVEYGSDVNAITTHDFTSYMLDYRENTPALLNEGMRLFRDFGDAVTFDSAAIDQERRVILSEMRSRDTLAERNMHASFPVVFRGLQFAQRAPIGTEQHIRSFTREHFVRFHERCYRPDLMVFVAAGDFSPEMMEAMTKEVFGSMKRPNTPIPARNEGRLDNRGVRAGVFRISGVGSAETMAASILPPTNRPDSRELVVERQRRNFVMGLFAERVRERIPEVGGSQADYQVVLGYEAAMASVRVPGPQWKHGILAVDQIVRNTHRHGFEPREIEELRRRDLRLAQHMLEQVPTLDPLMLCQSLSDSITEHAVFIGLEREYGWMRDWLERLTAAEALQTFRTLWSIDNMAFHVGGDIGIELAPAEIVKQVQQYRRGDLAYLPPPPHRERLPELRPRGQPGTVAERREVPDLKATLMRFGNNVRFNFVSSKQEPGLAQVVVRVGSGLVNMPGKRPALKEFGLDTLLSSGTARLRAEPLSRLVEERMLDFGFDVADHDAFTFRGQMAAENLDTFLGIVAEFLSTPQFANYAHASSRLRAAMGRSAGTVGMREAMRELTNHLFKDDARFAWGTPMDYISLSVLDVKRWMEPALKQGYVEVTIVGDLTEEAAVSSVAKTLGALGPRAANKESAPVASASVRAPAGFKRIEFVGEHNIGLVVGTWPVPGAVHLRDQAALEVLTKVLELRVREQVRENLGLSYGPSASFRPYDGFPGLALIQATADCAPTEADRVARVVGEVAARVATEGVKEGEFNGSRGILASQLRRDFMENGFLLMMLMRAQERPEELAEAIELKLGLTDRITLDEVNAWAKRVLPAQNGRIASLVPKRFIGIFESQRP